MKNLYNIACDYVSVIEEIEKTSDFQKLQALLSKETREDLDFKQEKTIYFQMVGYSP